VAVGFDAVVEPDHRAEVAQPRLARWPTLAGILVGDGVVDVLGPRCAGGVGERVDWAAQMDGFAERVGDLVGVDRYLVVEVDDRFDGDSAVP
jgi:hypothetical protein